MEPAPISIPLAGANYIQIGTCCPCLSVNNKSSENILVLAASTPPVNDTGAITVAPSITEMVPMQPGESLWVKMFNPASVGTIDVDGADHG